MGGRTPAEARHGRDGRAGAALLFLLLAGAGPSAAQVVPWETPFLLPPSSPGGIGIHFVDFDFAPDDGFGVAVTWRPAAAPEGVGVRAGLADGGGEGDAFVGGLAVFGGLDFSSYLARVSDAFPLDLIWTSGIGAGVGDYGLLSLPAGIAFGRQVSSPSISVNPYLASRVVLDARIGGDAPDEDFDVSVALDVGADFAFGDRRRIVLRTAASLGDRRALAIGLSTVLGAVN